MKTWDVIKEVIGTVKSSKYNVPKRMIIDGHETFTHEKIANCLNNNLN